MQRFVGDSGEFVRILSKYSVREIYFGTTVSWKQVKRKKATRATYEATSQSSESVVPVRDVVKYGTIYIGWY